MNLFRTHNDKVVQLQDLYTQLQSGTVKRFVILNITIFS